MYAAVVQRAGAVSTSASSRIPSPVAEGGVPWPQLVPDVIPGALVAYGWGERVVALFNDLADPGDEPARVVRAERSQSVVVSGDGRDHRVTGPSPPAVGDWVVLHDGVIRHVLPRWSAVTRRDPGGARDQVLAANADLVIITAPADRLSPARVERELAVAWDSGARPLVVLTKADVAAPEARVELEARLAGVDVVETSVTTGAGIDSVAEWLRPDRTAVLLGPSGAGKSSLANALLGSERLATGTVRDADHRGRHTTTTRQLVAVPGGGVLIDTPGLRSLALSDGVTGAIDQVFPEIDQLAADCRFADCSHEVEPGCAVTAAVAGGGLAPARLESFRKLQKEAAAAARRVDPLLRKAELSVWKARTKSVRANNRRKPR